MEPIENNAYETINGVNEIDEIEVMTETPDPAKKTRKPMFWIILGSVTLIVLAGAAFLAGRLLNQMGENGGGGGGGGGGMSFASSGPGGQTVIWSVNPSPDLPAEEATTMGIFQRKEDNSLFVGTGNIMMAVSIDESGLSDESSDVTADFDGPIVEVVVNRDTQIFHDVTEMPMDVTEGEVVVDQELETGSVDDIGPNSMVSVWGEKQGDRIIADVIVYQ